MSHPRGRITLPKPVGKAGREHPQVPPVLTAEESNRTTSCLNREQGKSTAEKNWWQDLILRAPAFPTGIRAAGAWHLKCNQLIHPVLGESIFSALCLVWSLLGKTGWADNNNSVSTSPAHGFLPYLVIVFLSSKPCVCGNLSFLLKKKCCLFLLMGLKKLKICHSTELKNYKPKEKNFNCALILNICIFNSTH